MIALALAVLSASNPLCERYLSDDGRRVHVREMDGAVAAATDAAAWHLALGRRKNNTLFMARGFASNGTVHADGAIRWADGALWAPRSPIGTYYVGRPGSSMLVTVSNDSRLYVGDSEVLHSRVELKPCGVIATRDQSGQVDGEGNVRWKSGEIWFPAAPPPLWWLASYESYTYDLASVAYDEKF